MGVKWYLIVVLIDISLRISGVYNFSQACWPFVYVYYMYINIYANILYMYI
jgi:hypothetical protein